MNTRMFVAINWILTVTVFIAFIVLTAPLIAVKGVTWTYACICIGLLVLLVVQTKMAWNLWKENPYP